MLYVSLISELGGTRSWRERWSVITGYSHLWVIYRC